MRPITAAHEKIMQRSASLRRMIDHDAPAQIEQR
jgi:hypothetical protein